ncbi:MAG TPA: polysaccharide pyruvyl transferase family protein [Candidatus Omnitrophota bacterium]|nr:polysaccharide pyruvyl transferase family protein [Candidatus Omnitrophota bacterium]
MKNRKNILFSTTRQWNPGDEFILTGILNLLRGIDPHFNPVIFNRNPEIQHESGSAFEMRFKGGIPRMKRLKLGMYDNSFKASLKDNKFIDLVIFAGSPEWASPRLKGLYDYIDKFSIPTAYMGIGLGADFDLSSLAETYKNVLKRSALIAVRDSLAQKKLAGFNPVLLPCPSLLAAAQEHERDIREVKTVGLIYSTHRSVRNNRLESATYSYMMDLYKRFLENYAGKLRFEFVCHYIDELAVFKQDFPSMNCFYSYDSSDYLKIYRQFDLVIGPRVHGIGICASMGIPGINLAHDLRAETCRGFQAEIIGVDTGFDKVIETIGSRVKQISGLNQRLLQHKKDILGRYTALVSPIIGALRGD